MPKQTRKARQLQAVRQAEALKHNASHDAITSDHLQAIHDHSSTMGAACADGSKHGAIHGASDPGKVQAIHDHAAGLGAQCAPGESAGGDPGELMETGKHFKSFKDYGDAGMPIAEMVQGVNIFDNPPDDVRAASAAIMSLCYLLEAEDDEPDDLKLIADTIRLLMQFIEGELQEAEAGEDPDDVMKSWATLKAIDKGVGGGVDRSKIPAEDFAGPDRTYPIVTASDVEDAAGLIGKAADPEAVKAKIIAIAKRKGFALPKSWADPSKHLNLGYLKSLRLPFTEAELLERAAVKSVGTDLIKHYPMMWGSKSLTDAELEYFVRPGTPGGSNFWDDVQGKSVHRPLTWDHAQDLVWHTKGVSPVIGYTVEFGDDELGRWAISKLDRAHQYRKMIDGLIERGVLGSSSDTAPQYIEREPTGKSTFLKTWPWFATALTDVPAEPRQVATLEFYKSIGVQLPEIDALARWQWEQSRLKIAKSKLFT